MFRIFIEKETKLYSRRLQARNSCYYSVQNFCLAQAKQQTKIQNFKKLTITIISDLNSNCQLPKPGDRSDFNTHKNC